MSTAICADAAIHYAKICHEAGILTSLDGGGLRSNTNELLQFIGVAVVAERLCEQMHLTPGEMLTYLKSRGCKIGGVTHGRRGHDLVRRERTERFMPSLSRAGRSRDRHQRRGRHLPRRLCLFVSCATRIRHGSGTSSSRARRPRTRSSIWATRRACPRSRKPTRRRRGLPSAGRAAAVIGLVSSR